MTEKDEKDLTVHIETTQGAWDTTFPKTSKVQDAIQAVVQHFSFASNGHYEFRLESDPDKALKPERPLVSYGIKNGDVMIFTDLGSAA